MSRLRRYYGQGTIYFVTTVTYDRQPILTANLDLVKTALARTKERFEIQMVAWAALPDHMHALIDIAEGNLSQVMKTFKQTFAFRFRSRLGVKAGRVWQHRFWDHVIRDQRDLNRHIDYIHYNPVRHGLVTSPGNYEGSTYSQFLARGLYRADWGIREEVVIDGDFGE